MNELIKEIEHFFKKRIGLNPESLSKGVWSDAASERMRALGIEDPGAYSKLIFDSEAEQKLLIDLLVVPETWFFRHQEAFNLLRSLVHTVWINENTRTEPLRLLSVPCSTGEEAYSIVMAMLEAGVPSNWFEVDAVDISPRLLEVANAGIYTRNAFRSANKKYRDKFFVDETNGYRILDIIKEKVRFIQSNLADPDFLKDEKPYDVVFCRNLFIYLQPDILPQLKKTFNRLVADNGYLIVSPVETQIPKIWGYSSYGLPAAAAFSKSTISITPAEPAKENELIANDNFLSRAHQQADAGYFETALDLCRKHIHDHSEDPEGYFLLGVIEHARGAEESAEKGFRKALYLAPTHRESLIYLALLAENKGNLQEATQFRKRAERI